MSNNLTADEILIAEFQHIAQVAVQNNEDRARVSTFYLVTVGSFIAGILGLQIEELNPQLINGAFGIIFFIIFVNGILTNLQLVKFRRAWFESVKAMNLIKDFYIQNENKLDLSNAFLWSNATLPTGFKFWSVSFLLTLQVAVFTGAALGAGIAFISLALAWLNSTRWVISITSGLVAAFLQILLYWLALRDI
ncbi:MAG: hypothetical protein PVG32_15120 [Anaerolineales bacterium]|jgi:hypothetical protein